MGGLSQQPQSEKISIKHWPNPLKGKALEISDFSHEEYVPILCENNNQSSDKCESKSSKILSTSELISGVHQLWNYASHSLTVSQSKKNLKNGGSSNFPREDIVHSLGKAKKGEAPTSAGVKPACCISPMEQSNLGFLKVTQKMSICENWGESCTQALLWRFLQDQSGSPGKYLNGKKPSSIGIPYEIQNMYGWVSVMIPSESKCPLNFTKTEISNTGKCCIQEENSCSSEIISGITSIYENNLAIGSDDLTLNENAEDVAKGRTSMCFDYSVHDVVTKGSASRSPSSSLCADHHDKSSASVEGKSQERQRRTGDSELLENKRKQCENYAIVSENKVEICSQVRDKPHYALAKRNHAFAGGLAGICVSLCLHPVDTVKTVVQSCRVDQKSICYIGRSIVSERGLSGLYRGISSNIASSAPISAVYTFTYESVKESLAPIFPKEYLSFAHCIAGGCASVATSFIFTPSEHIKQQMQVGSHYQNCWNALIGIIGKGGLPSLYIGWGAVLCRNVPHSIIKFYAYENLKQHMISSQQSNAHAQPSTLQTLLCGGLAGSTAALFTTPFDVVKTRLQTQFPGSVSQYSSVFHAIQEISKHEGVKSLYRGLTPRLVMYMTQGALFFTSYEFFKRIFTLEVSNHNTKKR